MRQYFSDSVFLSSIRNVLGSSICLMISVILFVVADVRETPDFWTHAGGQSMFMKDMVQFLFYPFYCVLFLINAIAVAHLLKRSRQGRSVICALLLVAGSMMLHFVTTIKVIVS